MGQIQAAVDQLYKTHFGRLVASLLSFSTDIDIATAEDLVQESFSAALIDWTKNGVPTNPSGWLYTVCRNKALNSLKKIKISTISSNGEDGYLIVDLESVVEDQQLKLLFMCANPDLPPKSQVAITLKYVINLKVEAIARLLGMTIDGVDKILIRARQKIKTENLLREEALNVHVLKPRLSIVHKIIYLIFNEGYRSSWGKEIIREELCEEALILNHSLLKSELSDKETKALHALMLFNSARIKSRFDANGEIVELENQDRSLWDHRLITLATEYLEHPRRRCSNVSHRSLHCLPALFSRNISNYPMGFDRQTLSTITTQHTQPFRRDELCHRDVLFRKKRKCFSNLKPAAAASFLESVFSAQRSTGETAFARW